jgi:hypothetical protein
MPQFQGARAHAEPLNCSTARPASPTATRRSAADLPTLPGPACFGLFMTIWSAVSVAPMWRFRRQP